jgi:hypothetical protein
MHLQDEQASQCLLSGHSVLKLSFKRYVEVRPDLFIGQINGQKVIWVLSPHCHPIYQGLDDSIDPLVDCFALDPSHTGENPHVEDAYGGVVSVHLPVDCEGVAEACEVVAIPIKNIRNCAIEGQCLGRLASC